MSYIDLGSTPWSEPCAQVGDDDYPAVSRRECRVFKRMLARLHPVPDGTPATFVVRSYPHDFGTYREVAINFFGTDAAAVRIACQVEVAVPESWDAIARYELAWFERREAHGAACDDHMPKAGGPRRFEQSAPPELPEQASLEELLAAYPL